VTVFFMFVIKIIVFQKYVFCNQGPYGVNAGRKTSAFTDAKLLKCRLDPKPRLIDCTQNT